MRGVIRDGIELLRNKSHPIYQVVCGEDSVRRGMPVSNKGYMTKYEGRFVTLTRCLKYLEASKYRGMV